MGNADYTDPKLLDELYWGRRMSLDEIGERFNVCASTVSYHMEKHDIPRRWSGTREERFEAYHRKDPETGCWIWQNVPNEWGYGTITTDGKTEMAHRVAYELYVGEIPDGKIICHTCHNPECVNPDHLYAGTHQDNTNDAMEINAWGENRPRGSKIGNSKLAEDQVREIKRRCRSGETQKSVAEDYPVSHSMVNKIMVGEWWTHID